MNDITSHASDAALRPSRPTSRKLLSSLLVLALVGGVGAVGSYSAFSATAANSGNVISSGTVNIGRDYSSPFYAMSNAKPGDVSTPSCTRLTYTGSLSATVRMYLSSGAITPAGAWGLKLERVTLPAGNAAGDCTGASSASTLYDGDLATFSTTYASYATGLDVKGSAWAQNDVVGLRVTATQNDDSTANAHTSSVSSGSHTFTWEARNS